MTAKDIAKTIALEVKEILKQGLEILEDQLEEYRKNRWKKFDDIESSEQYQQYVALQSSGVNLVH